MSPKSTVLISQCLFVYSIYWVKSVLNKTNCWNFTCGILIMPVILSMGWWVSDTKHFLHNSLFSTFIQLQRYSCIIIVIDVECHLGLWDRVEYYWRTCWATLKVINGQNTRTIVAFVQNKFWFCVEIWNITVFVRKFSYSKL